MIPCDVLKKAGLIEYHKDKNIPFNYLNNKQHRTIPVFEFICKLCPVGASDSWKSFYSPVGINQHLENNHPFELSIVKTNLGMKAD